jgi:DNA-binding NtrC family response regulator
VTTGAHLESARAMPEIRTLSRSRTVAVFDSHPDTVELLRLLFESDGFRVVTVDLREVRSGHINVAALHEKHAFDAAVFDIALPYQANWQLFIDLQARDLAGVPVVLTTTNERALDTLIGEEHPEVLEIWGKPYDTERLRARVHSVLNLEERRASGDDRPRGVERRRTAPGAQDVEVGTPGTTKRLTRSRS